MVSRGKTLLVISVLDLWTLGKRRGSQARWITLESYAKRGWQVYFITGNKEQNSIYEIYPNIHIIRFDAHWLKRWFRYKKIGFVAKVVWWLLFQLISFSLAVRIIREKHLKIDVIYGYEIMGVPVARLLKSLLRVPMVSRFQGTILHPWLGRRFWQFRHWQHFLAFKTSTDLIIMTNDGTRGDTVLNTLKVDMERVKFWINGVDKDMCQRIEFDEAELRKKLNIRKETKILLMLSRLENWKRVDRALTALPQVIQNHNEVLLIIIGDGQERCRLEELVDKLQIRANVRFLGALPHEEIWPYFKIADIFLSLYDLSNVGNPLLEAMSCGKCIITLNTGDTGQLIHHKDNGVLLELDELSHLPQVICELLEDAKLRQKLGQKAREFALEHFWTWDERMEEEISTVERIIKERKPSAR